MNILLVDDDQWNRMSISKFFEQMKHNITEADSGETAISLLSMRTFDLILSDIRMPTMSGIDLLRHIRQMSLGRETRVVMVTGYGTLNTAIEALRLGATDYLLKPVDADQLVEMLRRIENEKEEATMIDCSPCNTNFPLHSGIGVFSEELSRVFKDAEKYSLDRSIPVLIRGETGTGKEVIARIIHGDREGKERPFVDINCAAITPSLFESELFGYEPGSYTGGLTKGQKGKFDLAAGGTLFLDEVAEIPLELQGKLLRVLQEKEYYRVGGLTKIKTNVRIICATNVNLEEAIEKGQFRRDLYFRLKVGQLFLSPLRERANEILPLADMFMHEFSQQKKKSFQRIQPEAARILSQYSWPGNIRELRNVIERAVFMFDDIILRGEYLEDISINEVQFRESFFPLPEFNSEGSLDEHIVTLVMRTVEEHGGNKAAAARSLGISRSSVYRILERKSS